MSSPSRRILIAWLCLTAAFITPAQGFVLCVGENGHVAMERTHDPRPCTGCLDDPRGVPPAPAPHTGLSPVASDPADCPCVDLPVIGGDFARCRQSSVADQPIAALLPSALAADLAPAFQPTRTRSGLLASCELHLPPASLAQLRSPGLLI